MDRRVVAPSLDGVPYTDGRNKSHLYETTEALPAVCGLSLCILRRSHKFNQRVDVVCLRGGGILRSDQVSFCGLI
jgi:hypothetical protein